MSLLPPDWILLGYVTRAHGIKGALSYQLLHEDSDCLREDLDIALVSKSVRYMKVETMLTGDRFFLEGITDRTEAEKVAKTEIWVKRSDFQVLEHDEVYLADLIGFEVKDPEGNPMGFVTGFSDNRAQILVEVDHNLLVPFIKPILVKIDEDNRRIILDFPDAG